MGRGFEAFSPNPRTFRLYSKYGSDFQVWFPAGVGTDSFLGSKRFGILLTLYSRVEMQGENAVRYNIKVARRNTKCHKS